MKTISLLGLGAKALTALRGVPVHLRGMIVEVILARDGNVLDDYADEIRTFCTESGIPCVERTDRKPQGDIIVAIGWRWMVSPLPGQQLVVFHDSLLPMYRGFNPLVTALINGDKSVGVTALFGAAEFDEGSIIAQRSAAIVYPMKVGRAISIVSALYSELLVWVVEECAAGRALVGRPQNDAEATYSLWRDHEDYSIDWNQPASRIKRMIDAVGYPYQGARTTIQGTTVIVDEAEEIVDREIANRTPGKVFFKREGRPVVVCNPGLLLLTSLRTEKGDVFDFGNRLRIRLK